MQSVPERWPLLVTKTLVKV